MKAQHFYLIHIQYIGFRFHGWAKQPEVKTIHYMIDRTLAFVLGHRDFKTMGSSRTDSKVSALDNAFELFLHEPIQDESDFLHRTNLNLPPDIKAIGIKKVDSGFNIIKSPRTKEYIYLFAFGEKPHPFSAPFITTVPEELNLELMKEGAKLFEGIHEFKAYCKRPKEDTITQREILFSRIEENQEFKANFFPTKSYIYRVKAAGFLRHQIRMMVGQLFLLGKGETSLEEISLSLKGKHTKEIFQVAPGSGLILYKIDFEEK
ncbi:pseudouridine synthase [Roseivirga seohaensis subsp. aquiponti]|uniref:tRNA pseudouridine synthase A n=1 Tax=Roseivirga seohaensis subsp. aquiponti TaxID=1566026 RepID=A0A0L8APL8_9BACT|nr:tRNA pseudouridine synthase A [Roseivirga seohaensis]KOF04423.1 pseudouridine synthase [Roseivirga seohaensis subsp. aquiponti]